MYTYFVLFGAKQLTSEVNKVSIATPIFRAELKILASPKIHKKVSLKFILTSIRCFLIAFFFVFRFTEIHMKKVTIIPNRVMKGTIRYPRISCFENGSQVLKAISTVIHMDRTQAGATVEFKTWKLENFSFFSRLAMSENRNIFLKSFLKVSLLYKNGNNV